VSVENVQFYTEEAGITASDRTRIAALTLNKPIHMPPIEATTDQWQALANLVECYKASFDAEGVCHCPFMLLVNPDNFTAALGQVEAAEALSVYRLLYIHATTLRLDEIASSTGKVVLRLGVTFGIPDKAMNVYSGDFAPPCMLCYNDVSRCKVSVARLITKQRYSHLYNLLKQPATVDS
jgi:hypothetical protein